MRHNYIFGDGNDKVVILFLSFLHVVAKTTHNVQFLALE